MRSRGTKGAIIQKRFFSSLLLHSSLVAGRSLSLCHAISLISFFVRVMKTVSSGTPATRYSRRLCPVVCPGAFHWLSTNALGSIFSVMS